MKTNKSGFLIIPAIVAIVAITTAVVVFTPMVKKEVKAHIQSPVK